jgi:sigma-B regulation protein RsbU (phosphoserine phosphatase)
MRHALLSTLPGRAIVIGAAVKLAIAIAGAMLPAAGLLTALDTLASVAIVAGGAYFVAQGLTFAKRRLLWRVRRKLIISYIFIGVVPAILIVAFFLLGGMLLFSNFSSYLVQSKFRSIAERAGAAADMIAAELRRTSGTALGELLDRRLQDGRREFPAVSMAVLPAARRCGQAGASGAVLASADLRRLPAFVGDWKHVAPPDTVPDWIPCEGFRGLLAAAPAAGVEQSAANRTGLLVPGTPVAVIVRAASFAFADGRPVAVIVDIPVDRQVADRLRRETGVALSEVSALPNDVRPLLLRSGATPSLLAGSASDLPMSSVAFLDGVDWDTGRSVELRAASRMNVSEIYSRIAVGENGRGQDFGQGMLLFLIVIGVLFLVIEALALAAGLALARSITGSVHELFGGTERVRHGDFTHKISIDTHDQLGELAESFNSMTASIEDLLREQAEKKRLEEELRIAHEIQMSLLPQGPLGTPGLSVTALCVPAREVGGDYYDFLTLGDDRVAILIADVSGKGTSAALYMAELKGLMLSLSRIHESPRDLLIAADRIIAEHLDARSFITITYAVFDLRARTLTYARAGHTPLIYLPADRSATPHLHVLAPDGLVLGLKLDNGETFERVLREERMTIHEGDLFLFFTDGITEAMNDADDCFGELRLGRLIEDHGHLPSDELRERVLREIGAFVGGAPQHDDMTMILLRIAGLDAIGAAAAPAVEVSRV